jgi:hypothetical protein
MEKNLTMLVAISALALGACTEERTALDRAPGKYERTTVSTDAEGTTTKRESSTEVDVDDEGHKKAVVKSKTTKDPKGLLNKTTTSESKQVIEEKD